MAKIHAQLEATPLVAISSYCASLPDRASGFGLLLGRYHRNSWTLSVACVGPVCDLSNDFACHLKHLRHLARLEIDVHAGLQVAGLFVVGVRSPGGESSDGVDLDSGVTLDALVQLAFDEFLLRLEPVCDPLLMMIETKEITLDGTPHRVLASVRALTPDCHPPVSFNSRSDRISFDSVSLEVSAAPEEAIAAFSVVRGLVVHSETATFVQQILSPVQLRNESQDTKRTRLRLKLLPSWCLRSR
ncbi:MAG: uncharacterized protein KVP18_004691 [Porospora cf. gigantea A]|uniref:uncharacterized protein n=1 Tax=Porospora cf. gigantea A TaxID=2853593 RepID=UPI003559D7EC|nr:MAG: hypothetical protein KVP18_004691 [Porospora cf. gigantea A]